MRAPATPAGVHDLHLVAGADEVEVVDAGDHSRRTARLSMKSGLLVVPSTDRNRMSIVAASAEPKLHAPMAGSSRPKKASALAMTCRR
jgi:hypothetical protein